MHSQAVVAARESRPKFAASGAFRRDLDQRIDAYFERTGRSRWGDWRMHLKTVALLGWLAGSWALLVFVAATWWQGLLLAGSLAMAIAGVGFGVMHDANHGAYSRHRFVNRLLERTLDMLGASSYLWRWKHNVFHHSYTNLVGADNDIDLSPFARLAPEQPHRAVHRFQHIYMWALYGFTVYHMHFVEDFAQLRSGRIGRHHYPRPKGWRVFELFASKVFVLGWSLAIPMFFHRWWVVLAFYASLWFAVGLILGVVFQVAHCAEEVEFPSASESGRIEHSWAVHQVETTVDFAPRNRLLTAYVGGLNFQIEHHLFPKICHVHYPQLAPIVREVCAEHGVRYTVHERFVSALSSHGQWLRRMGRRPESASAPA